VTDPRQQERLNELLADRATVGLTPDEARELETLLTGASDESHELAAAALDLALGPTQLEALPASLRAKLAARGEEFVASRAAIAKRASMQALPAPRRPNAAAWWLAAAAAVLALIGWWPRFGSTGTKLGPQELLARAGTLRIDAKGTELAKDLHGDVLWSNELQSGYLRLSGLPANDPKVAQYQLWIVDADQQHPIDGGVFDAASGELVIPIDAKLRVGTPKAFAITLEKPGGVVVSDLGKVAMLVNV
jgi:anti-sigma-K factor RskA